MSLGSSITIIVSAHLICYSWDRKIGIIGVQYNSNVIIP